MLNIFVYLWLASAARGSIRPLTHLAVFCENRLVSNGATHANTYLHADEDRLLKAYVTLGTRLSGLADRGYFDPEEIGRLRYLRGSLERSLRADVQRALDRYLPLETPTPPPINWRNLVMRSFGLAE